MRLVSRLFTLVLVGCVFIFWAVSRKYLNKITQDRNANVLQHGRIAVRNNADNIHKPFEICKDKRRHFVFLKTPKTGSSTVQNIFFRYGLKHNLSFMLPKYLNYISYFPRIQSRFILPSPTGKTYEIICSHVMYNRSAFRRFFPPDTEYVGILRKPLENFVSYILYYHRETFNHTNALKKYLSQSEIYENLPRPYKIPANLMSDYMGFQEEWRNSMEAIWNFIHNIDAEFAQLLILESLDESLLLLKRKFCWDLQDILYVSKMKNPFKPDHITIDASDESRYRQLAKVDNMLYDFFNRKVQEKIMIETERSRNDFWEELNFFKAVRQRVTNHCHVIQYAPNPWSISIEKSRWNEAFDVSSVMCNLLLMPELEIQNYIGSHQYGENRWSQMHENIPLLH